jgi:hypothetical protein
VPRQNAIAHGIDSDQLYFVERLGDYEQFVKEYVRKDNHMPVCGKWLAKYDGIHYRCKKGPPDHVLSNVDHKCIHHTKYERRLKKTWNQRKATMKQIKALRGPMADAVEKATADRELLDLRPHIALFDIRLEQISERMADNSATPEDWQKARDHLQQHFKCLEREDEKKAEYHLEQLMEILEAGTDHERAWKVLLETTERRAKRTEKAQELLIKSASMIAQADLRWFVARVQDIIAEEARGQAAERIITRIAEECLGRIAPGAAEEFEDSSQLLPRVQGEGVGVRSGGAGGEVLEVSASSHREPVQAQERGSEDMPRGGEDEGSSGLRADLFDDEGGQHRSLDGSDGSSGSEPTMG